MERNQARGLIIWKQNGDGSRGGLRYCSFRAKELLGLPQDVDIYADENLRKRAEAKFSEFENSSTRILFNETVYDLSN